MIMDGRDIGTVVLPDAKVKSFLPHLPRQEPKDDTKNFWKRE